VDTREGEKRITSSLTTRPKRKGCAGTWVKRKGLSKGEGPTVLRNCKEKTQLLGGREGRLLLYLEVGERLPVLDAERKGLREGCDGGEPLLFRRLREKRKPQVARRFKEACCAY